MSQLIFEWPNLESYSTTDFIVSESNKTAKHFIDTWPDKKTGIALLSAPTASGKTHLAHIWATRMNAIVIENASLGTLSSEELWQNRSHAVLENIHSINNEKAFFHLLRHAESHHSTLLLTSNLSAKEHPFTLPDLRSRLMAMPTASIEVPDDKLLQIFLVKCFADRQLQVSPEVIAYLIKRIERSFDSTRALVQNLERASSEGKRDITIALVKSLMKKSELH